LAQIVTSDESPCSVNEESVERFVVRPGLELSKSSKPAAIFQKPYKSDDPQKDRHRSRANVGETRGRGRKFTSGYGVGSARFSKLPVPSPSSPCQVDSWLPDEPGPVDGQRPGGSAVLWTHRTEKKYLSKPLLPRKVCKYPEPPARRRRRLLGGMFFSGETTRRYLQTSEINFFELQHC
jgi:hypothetical protein